MNETYFHRLQRQTPTTFWVNNPTLEETDLAIEAGARGCTCNPSFCQKMINHPVEGPPALAILDEVLRETDNDSAAEALLQRRLAAPIIAKFRPLYEANPRLDGFVTLQGDPIREHDPEVILSEARDNRAIAPNVSIKIPCTRAGLIAMEELIAEGTPITATEVMSVAQTISLCETFERCVRQKGQRPVVFLAHIAGIYDDYLAQYVKREKIEISRDVLWQAGIAIGRKVYQTMQERGYSAVFLGGGARGLHHFTEFVGGNLIVTINWKGTADKLIESDPPVVYRMFNPVPHRVIEELIEKLPDFRRAYFEDGLSVDEYVDFGGVAHFRNMFVKSWNRVLELAAARRPLVAATA